MGRHATPLEQTFGMAIYYEMLDYAEFYQTIPRPYSLWRNIMVPKGYRLSKGTFDYWLSRLLGAGLLEPCPAGDYRLRDVSLSVGIGAELRNEHLVKFVEQRALASRRKQTEQFIQTSYKNQKGRCWWCESELLGVYHIDHRIPVAKGGSDEENNLCLACPDCNNKKSSRMPYEFNGRLL